MSSLSPADIARRLRRDFSPTASQSIEEAVETVLATDGLSRFEAASVALEIADTVLAHLRADPVKNLSFHFSADGRRLVGKARQRAGDADIAARVRARIGHLNELRLAVASLTPCEFERLSASLMLLYGATDAVAGCASGDGGIDVYGRIPVREYSDGLPTDLLGRLFLARRPVLFFGQCKSIGIEGGVGRPELAQFSADVASCLSQYAGAVKPPPHRVPAAYYARNEATLSLFFTTGGFSADAIGSDVALGIFLIDGLAIAEAMLFHAVGFVDTGSGPAVSPEKVREFAVGSAAIYATSPST